MTNNEIELYVVEKHLDRCMTNLGLLLVKEFT